jgi:DNA-directed RNA polymerase subunit RPC12/RpoP
MQCPVCGKKYNDPEEQEYIEKYDICSKCDKEGADLENYDKED